MSKDKRIDSYLKSRPAWQKNLMLSLRRAVHASSGELEETIKWGSPWFGYHGTHVAWMFSAAKWVHFSLSQGALLDHSHGLFEPTDNKAMRTIKFKVDDKVPSSLITELVNETIKIIDAGNTIRFKHPKKGEKDFDAPPEYEEFLKAKNKWDEYGSRPYYQKKGWIEWIEQAKRPETKQKRMNKMIEELVDGTYMPPKNN